MHGLEAFIAMGTATGDAVWHQRGLAIADRLINTAAHDSELAPPGALHRRLAGAARLQPGRAPASLPAVRRDLRSLARGVGVLLQLDASPLVGSPQWLTEAADGSPPVVRLTGDGPSTAAPGWLTPSTGTATRWPTSACTGRSARASRPRAALLRRTGDPHWEGWYRRLWDHAARWFIDERGAWGATKLDEGMRQGEKGVARPPADVYHCGGALTLPLEGLSLSRTARGTRRRRVTPPCDVPTLDRWDSPTWSPVTRPRPRTRRHSRWPSTASRSTGVPGARTAVGSGWRLRRDRGRIAWVNVWEDDAGRAYVASVNDGNETVPTVVIDGIPHTNPHPALVKRALDAQ